LAEKQRAVLAQVVQNAEHQISVIRPATIFSNSVHGLIAFCGLFRGRKPVNGSATS
jgi:hypothetical protein